jgi:hypothetical protein
MFLTSGLNNTYTVQELARLRHFWGCDNVEVILRCDIPVVLVKITKLNIRRLKTKTQLYLKYNCVLTFKRLLLDFVILQ